MEVENMGWHHLVDKMEEVVVVHHRVIAVAYHKVKVVVVVHHKVQVVVMVSHKVRVVVVVRHRVLVVVIVHRMGMVEQADECRQD